ncbi:MAG: hypothetical protein ACTSRG_05325 [Candidatus Helarchaeota archaeon]
MKGTRSKRNKKRVIILFLVVAIIIITIPLISSTSLEVTASSEIVIAFDESHNQFCRFDNYQGNFILPLTLLNMSTRYNVRIIRNGTTLSPLQLIGVDILVIGNPGINSTYNQTELNTITSFVLTGGSLLLMSEGYFENRYPLNSSPPNTRELNKILKAIGLVFVGFTNQTLRDESQYFYYYVGDTHQIPIPSSSFSKQSSISTGIGMVLTFASNINIDPLFFSNNIFATGRIMNLGNFIWPLSSAEGTFLPVWLAGFELFTGSRILLCGSTMMFSDLVPVGTHLPWYFSADTSEFGPLFGFPTFDNSRLWMNMFDWLTMSKNQSFLPFIVTFLVGIIGIFGVGLSLLIYSQKMKIKELEFEVAAKEKEELPIILERAQTLKSARLNLKEGMPLKAIELYKKAAKLSSKIKDDELRKRFSKKVRDLRALKKLR